MTDSFTQARNTLIGWTMNELFRGRLTAVQADVIKARVMEMETASLENQRGDADAPVISLSPVDQQTVADALLNPPEPTPALRRAMALHREFFGEGTV